ncbi:MAG TPA: DciA family protein [Sphingomonas sp.]|nr:DciA family protein [Sphingomonas sp.]
MTKTPKPTARATTRQPKPEPQRSNRARPVSELLPDVGRAAFRKFGFVQHSVVSRWSEIVGERYARVSIPESIRFPQGKRAEGVLSLVVSGAHAPMMQHIAPEIVERVNRFFGYPAVARLAIRHGEVKRTEKAAPPPGLKPVPESLGQSLRGIVDPELKAVLEALAAGVAANGETPQLGRID